MKSHATKFKKMLLNNNYNIIQSIRLQSSNNKNSFTKFSFIKFCSNNNNSTLNSNNNQLIFDETSNTPNNIITKVGQNKYKQKNHPLEIITKLMIEFFKNDECKKSSIPGLDLNNKFEVFDSLSPVVSIKDCFSDLLVENSHETVSPKNTYFINKNQVLRTHMTTHDVPLLKQNKHSFVSVGDVYRRDTIDATHYPVFHQIDGVRVYKNTSKEIVFQELKFCLENLIK